MFVVHYKLVNEVYRNIIKEPLCSNKCKKHVLDGSTIAKDIYSTYEEEAANYLQNKSK